MFKPLQVVEAYGITGIVSEVKGRFVTIMWETATGNGVEFQTSTAIQWGKVAGLRAVS